MTRRIVCLSAESADILRRIGAEASLVGVTVYAALPPRLRGVPRVSGFSAGNIKRIVALKPDLVIGYSDVQAPLAAELIRAGVNVLVTHQVSLRQIEENIHLLGRLTGRERAAARLVKDFRAGLRPRRVRVRPRVYFEEWPGPLVAGIGWVGELIECAGGQDIFPELRGVRRAEARVVTEAEVARRNPEVIVASWCGKPVKTGQIRAREGWQGMAAVRAGRIFAIESSKILQPGPALVAGYRELSRILRLLSLGYRNEGG